MILLFQLQNLTLAAVDAILNSSDVRFAHAFERSYAAPTLQASIDEYTQRNLDRFASSFSFRVSLLVCTVLLLLGMQTWYHGPLVLALHEEVRRIRSILLMFPVEVLANMARTNTHLQRQLGLAKSRGNREPT